MKKIVVSAIGKDRPGIVSSVTETLFQAGCNLEDSAMTILEGEFAILLICSKPTKMPMKRFQSVLVARAKKMGLVLHVKEMDVARGKASSPIRTAIVTVSGTDQTGILFRLSNVLARLKINITDLTSRQIPSPKKTALYVVMIEIAIPQGLMLDDLRKALDKIAGAMHLDISVREINVEQL